MKKNTIHIVLAVIFLVIVSGWVFSQSTSFKSIERTVSPDKIEKSKDLFRDELGIPYPFGADPLYFMRLAENILDHGHPGETIKDNKPYDTLALAPIGKPVTTSIYPYVFAGFHKIMGRDLPLHRTAVWLPVIIGIASVLLIFFLGKTLYNTLIGFYTALIFTFHPFFNAWNYAGFADTNAINMFFSLLIVFSLLKTYQSKNKHRYAWCALALVAFILFFKTWTGAFYLVVVLGLIAAAVALTKAKKPLPILLGAAVVCAVFFFKYGYLVKKRLFPTDITAQSISELKAVTFPEFVQATGGKIMFLIILAALILFIINICKKPKTNWKSAALLAWFLPLCIVGILSKRFLFYAAPPLALILGVFWGKVRNWAIPLLKNNKLVTAITIILIPLLLWTSVSVMQQLLPYTNDALVDTAYFIRDNTDENTIVTTWWDRGYHFQYYADRPTLIDPGTLGYRDMNLIAEFFFTKDEQEALNTLQKLRCGLDLNMQNTTCPPTVIIVTERILGLATEIQKLVQPDQEIKITRASKCIEKEQAILCENGFQVIGDRAIKNNALPKRFDDYRGEGKKITNYNVTDNNVVFVLYDNEQGLYSFITTEPYADALFTRFLAQDTFNNFNLIYKTEFPEQIYTYEVIKDSIT